MGSRACRCQSDLTRSSQARRMCKQEALAKFQTMETKQTAESSQIMDQKFPYIVARNAALLF